MRLGDKGKEVEELQEKLNTMFSKTGNHLPLTCDGVFGRKTQDIVWSFQYGYNLETDGIAGPKTMKALNLALRELCRADILSQAEFIQDILAVLGATDEVFEGLGVKWMDCRELLGNVWQVN